MDEATLIKHLANHKREVLEDLKKEILIAISGYYPEEESCEELYNEEYANINGILLKRENEKFAYCEHFTYEEALKLFQGEEKRVPTSEEWEIMLKPGYTWDEEKKGIWIGEKHACKEECNFSTFLPAAGHLYRIAGELVNMNSTGYYWSSSPCGTDALYLNFDGSTVNPTYSFYRPYGFSVRCIKNNL
jgi:uncharacterized protein (TIGR02145 family)